MGMKADKRKREIMEASLKLFARQGYHATTVADIIDELGVARGTFYRYFDDKHDLFEKLLETNFKYVKKALPLPAENTSISAPDLEDLLSRVFLELVSQPNSRDFMSMMVNEAAGADRHFAEKVQGFYDDLALVFASYITRMQEVGLIREVDPRISAYLLLGSLKEVFIQWGRGKKFEDLDHVIHEAASFIVKAMRADPAEERPEASQ